MLLIFEAFTTGFPLAFEEARRLKPIWFIIFLHLAFVTSCLGSLSVLICIRLSSSFASHSRSL